MEAMSSPPPNKIARLNSSHVQECHQSYIYFTFFRLTASAGQENPDLPRKSRLRN